MIIFSLISSRRDSFVSEKTSRPSPRRRALEWVIPWGILFILRIGLGTALNSGIDSPTIFPTLYGQEGVGQAEANGAENPFADEESGEESKIGEDGGLRDSERGRVTGNVSSTSPARSFRTKKGVDIPLIDDKGKVIYQRPEDKDPAEMSEEDFYKTLTPAENVLLSKNPTSGPDLFEAAIMISRIGRPEFAKLLAEKGFSAPGTPKEFSDLIDRVGEDKLIHFSRNAVIGETAGQVVDKIRSEAKKEWQNPDFVRSAFEKTFSNAPEVRTAAVLDLRKGGNVSFDFLLTELASDDSKRREQAEMILGRLGSFAADGLLTKIRKSEGEELARLVDVLAQTKNLPDITPLLVLYYDEATPPESRALFEKGIRAQLGSIPSREDGAQGAYQKGMTYFDRKIVLPNVANGHFSLWIWNDQGEMESVTLPVEEALRRLAAQSLTDAFRLDPTRPEIVSAAAVAVSEDSLYRNGLDAPILTDSITEIFPGLTTRQWEAALDFAMKSGRFKGGIVPAVLLGRSGDVSFCVGDGKPSVLVQAATAKDRRLRFAALKSIVDLAPTVPYAGSSGVTSALIDFTTSLGKRKAIVALPQLDLIGLTGNYLSDGNVLTVPAQTGGEIIASAQTDADVEFVLAVSYVKKPDLRTVAQTLAADYRTADIPIIVASEDETRTDQALRYGEGEKNASVFILPFDKESGKRGVKELFEKTDPRQVPADVRLARSKEGIRLLEKLRKTGGDLYHFEDIDALAARFLVTPALTWEGVDFAMTVPSKSVQVILSELTFDHRFDVGDRENYLAALGKHIGSFGLLMRGPDILRLFSGPWPGDSGEIRKEFFQLLTDHSREKEEMALSIPSPHIQNLLGDLVGDDAVDAVKRKDYLDLFTRHLAKYGLLLEKPDVRRLYDRYNASENESKENQELLAGLLDAIELWQSGRLTVR